jgi:hypothetical protein
MPPKPLADRIANKLAHGIPIRDLVAEVSEATGMDWDASEKYIREIAHFRQAHIANQRFPILALISLGTALLGIGILAYTILPLQADLSAALASLTDSSALNLALHFFANSPVFGEILVGVLMVFGGLIGLARALYDRLQGD